MSVTPASNTRVGKREYMSKTRTSRLVSNTNSTVTIKADVNVQHALQQLVDEHDFVSRSEAVVEALFQLANRLGLKRKDGGIYPLLEHLGETKISDKIKKRNELLEITNASSSRDRQLLEQLTS